MGTPLSYLSIQGYFGNPFFALSRPAKYFGNESSIFF